MNHDQRPACLDGVGPMGGRKRVPEAAPANTGMVRRLVRGRRFDRNPLRRASDRAETLVLILLAVAFLAGAPFVALAAGGWARAVALHAQRAQEAAVRQVTAVVLAVSAPPPVGERFAWEAKARWRAPDGREVTREVPLPYSPAVGGSLTVWTDRAGDLASAPLLDSQLAGQATTGEALGVAGMAAALLLAGGLARWTLNRRRLAAWDADWQATSPRWTSRA
jgi:hypothetical protein